MSTTPAVREDGDHERTPAQQIVNGIRSDDFKRQIALALPGGVAPERFVRATVTALMQNADLADADRDSLFQAVIRAAQDGLMPDGREAALVIFNAKVKVGGKDTWIKKVQYMPMIGGFRKIAAEYGWIIRTHVVYANDVYEYELGLDEKLIHRPARPGVERGDRVAAYAVGVHKDGRKLFEPMSDEDIAKCRKVSRASDKGPWVDWTDRMWEKTVGRRLFAKLPLDGADRERIDRVMAADLPPLDAATLMYGPVAARPALAPSPGVQHQAPAVDRTPAESQQAGASESDQGPEPRVGSDAPAPGDQFEGSDEPDEVEGTVVGDDLTETDIAAANAAAEHVINVQPKEAWVNGLTVGQVHAEGERGLEFFRWALGPKSKGVKLRAAVSAFMKVELPFMYAELVVGGEQS